MVGAYSSLSSLNPCKEALMPLLKPNDPLKTKRRIRAEAAVAVVAAVEVAVKAAEVVADDLSEVTKPVTESVTKKSTKKAS